MKKKAIIVLGILVLLGAIIFTSYSYFKVKQWDSLILPKIKIENEDLTGKTKEQAQIIMKEKYSSKVIKKKITIVNEDKKYTLDYSMLDAKYNIDEAIKQAMSYGSDMNMLQRYKAIKNPDDKQIKLTFEYNDKAVDKILEEMTKDINKDPVNATITMVSSGNFSVTSDAYGKQLESVKLKKEIKSKINGLLSGDDISITAPVKKLSPKVTEASLNAINTKISSYSTNFASSQEGRATNIELSTKSINGTLLMPGDVFSFNGIVGERTAARGYKTAGVIVGDKLEQGLGGGICQVSSTLYNAMLTTEILSVERIHHTISSGYIPKGQDATVDYGNLDYKFKNTFEYPIYIEGVISNRNLSFNIYSNSTLTKRTYEIVSEVLEVTQPKTETIQDPTKYEDEKEIVKTGYAGFKVKVYRKTYENGKLIGTQVINNDTFNVINGTIKVGTKKRA
ncbi:VanW family protein [Clostridium sp. CM027]|uniref:VanW family protein n=1 Tax=Clostridium sp. CM027 TaxID=2849865 RepID=UPI001C6F0BD8|nr:VanW family protein [Clostridium sp. CM027]MBW9144633.1 VanW family protein [Clostridium sp. CM027]UVE40610.1 VanW family protein [Clostridium sp. CM027]